LFLKEALNAKITVNNNEAIHMKECNILLIEGDKRVPENEFNYKFNIRARDNVQLVMFQQLMF